MFNYVVFEWNDKRTDCESIASFALLEDAQLFCKTLNDRDGKELSIESQRDHHGKYSAKTIPVQGLPISVDVC